MSSQTVAHCKKCGMLPWRGCGNEGCPYSTAVIASIASSGSAQNVATLEQNAELKLKKIQKIVDTYFAPWGAGKAAQWEDLSGDREFSPQMALSLIERELRK